jgi:predicted signal transduction protein with EAL and GGDEF domain
MFSRNVLLFFLVSVSTVFLILFIKKYRKEKMIQSKYELLQKKLLTNHNLLSKNDNLSLDNDSDWLDIQKSIL